MSQSAKRPTFFSDSPGICKHNVSNKMMSLEPSCCNLFGDLRALVGFLFFFSPCKNGEENAHACVQIPLEPPLAPPATDSKNKQHLVVSAWGLKLLICHSKANLFKHFPISDCSITSFSVVSALSRSHLLAVFLFMLNSRRVDTALNSLRQPVE